jgi:DUSP domain
MDWLKKWKHYVYYKKLKKQVGISVSYSEEHLRSEYPGSIKNEVLLKRFDRYLRDDNERDVSNYVTRSKIREGYDYRFITKDGWTKLQSKYGGLEIKREKDDESYNRKYLVKFPLVIY